MERMESSTDPDVTELGRADALSLLATAPFGRLVFTEGVLPAVLALSFALDGGRIVVRTREGGVVSSTVPGQVVAFQADDLDPVRRCGWSVTVVGRATRVEDPLERERLARLLLAPWTSGERRAFVTVDVGLVTGRRLGGAEPARRSVAAAAADPRAGAA